MKTVLFLLGLLLHCYYVASDDYTEGGYVKPHTIQRVYVKLGGTVGFPGYMYDGDTNTNFDSGWLGTASACQDIIFDFGQVVNVGYISHYLPGSVPQLNISLSLNNVTWVSPPHSTITMVWGWLVDTLGSNTAAQYAKLSACGVGKWNTMEIRFYDFFGPYGQHATTHAYANPKTFREILGLNVFVGYGGPAQNRSAYSGLVSYVRDYHDIDWDIPSPPNTIPNIAPPHLVQSSLNWSTVYGQWTKDVGPVQASIQITNSSNFRSARWDPNPGATRQQAYNYGYAFASFFKGRGLVTHAEIGNEPWDFDGSFFSQIIDGMSAGLKAADPGLQVMGGAFQCDDPTADNYLPNFIPQSVMNNGNIDVLNTHHYSFRSGLKAGNIITAATYPEDPASDINGAKNVVRWRNLNAPGKPVFVSEWGYDISSQYDSPACLSDAYHDVCVSVDAGSTYAPRGLLVLARSGAERATWFYWMNLAGSGAIFSRSGLLSINGAHKENVWYSFNNFLNVVGDMYHLAVVYEDIDAYVYLLGDANHNTMGVVAWRPVSADDAAVGSITFTNSYGFDLRGSTGVRFLTSTAPSVSLSSVVSVNPSTNAWTVTIDKYITYIPVTPVTLTPDGGGGSLTSSSSGVHPKLMVVTAIMVFILYAVWAF